jgi:hypothetical protein
MFATISLVTPPTPDSTYPYYATFRVESLEGATCRDTRTGGGQPPWTSSAFPQGGMSEYEYFLPMHGGGTNRWPAGTYTIYTTCTLAGVSVQSASIQVTWPA